MGLFSSFHRGQQLSNDHDFWPEKKILISGQKKPLWKILGGGKKAYDSNTEGKQIKEVTSSCHIVLPLFSFPVKYAVSPKNQSL